MVDSSSPSANDTPTGVDNGGNPDVETTNAPVPDTPSTDEPSASPSDAQGESKESLLDAVLKAVPPKGEDPDRILPGEGAPPGSEGQQSGEPDPAAENTEADDPSEEEMARYTSRTRDRIKQLLTQRDSARTEAETHKADAEMANGLRSFLSEHRIQKEDFTLLLDLGVALRKGDFRTFYEGVGPYVQLAEEALGITLPADLQAAVQQGMMTTEAARQYSRERMARQIAESQNTQTQQETQQFVSRQQQDALSQAVSGAVNQWEARTRQQDPDYGHKQDLVKDMLWSVIRETGTPQTPEHAVQIAQEAYRRVNDAAARFRPAPRATQAVPSSVHRATGATPEPKTLMEAAMIGLERARR
jgi:hypothetical protein